MKEVKIISSLHTKTKRNYIERMINQKSKCMKISKKYGFDYWDGKREFGYGGYKYIPGRWNGVAKKLIKLFKLNNKSKILLQIHDELIFEVQEKEVKNVTNIIQEEMTSVTESDLHSFSTPLTVDVNTGDNWGILH